MKMLRDNANKQDRVKFLQEAAIMGQFNHPHIVKLLGAITAAEPMMLVLELLQEGDLLQWLENHSSKNEVDVADMPKQLLYYSQDIADGMKYLSNKGFIHRDLAARNILLDKNLRCKVQCFPF
jgi:ephrin-B